LNRFVADDERLLRKRKDEHTALPVDVRTLPELGIVYECVSLAARHLATASRLYEGNDELSGEFCSRGERVGLRARDRAVVSPAMALEKQPLGIVLRWVILSVSDTPDRLHLDALGYDPDSRRASEVRERLLSYEHRGSTVLTH
jgi:hypothetical protein